MNDALRKALKRLRNSPEIMLTCMRWYVAYPLSLRHIEEMMGSVAVGTPVTPRRPRRSI